MKPQLVVDRDQEFADELLKFFELTGSRDFDMKEISKWGCDLIAVIEEHNMDARLMLERLVDRSTSILAYTCIVAEQIMDNTPEEIAPMVTRHIEANVRKKVGFLRECGFGKEQAS